MNLCKLLPFVSLVVLASCAKNPETPPGAAQQYLEVRLNYRSQIRTNFRLGGGYYIVINRVDAIGDPGPIPVVQGPPWGNGFAAPSDSVSQGFIGYVRFSADGSGSGTSLGTYNVYTTEIGGTVQNPVTNQFRLLGQPDNFIVPNSGGNELYFRLNLARLPFSTKRYLQLNFISTDISPVGVDNPTKSWDALGDGTRTGSLNAWITLDTQQNPQLSNATQLDREPENDVRDRQNGVIDDAGLDLNDWTVSIRQQ